MRTLQRWFRSAARAVSFQGSRAFPRKRFQPAVELLEVRCVPSTIYTVDSLLDAAVDPVERFVHPSSEARE